MRKHRAIGGKHRNYASYLANYTYRNILLIVLGGLFLFGVLAGALLMRTAQGDIQALLIKLTDQFISQRARQNLSEVFFSCASSSLLFLLILFACGYCAIAQPAIVCIPFFRGLGFGFSVASMYAQHGIGAAGYIGLFLLPDMLLSTLAMLLCCRESIRLSGSFLMSARPERQDREFYPIRIYIARYVAAATLCLLSAFLQAVLFIAFANSVVLG